MLYGLLVVTILWFNIVSKHCVKTLCQNIVSKHCVKTLCQNIVLITDKPVCVCSYIITDYMLQVIGT